MDYQKDPKTKYLLKLALYLLFPVVLVIFVSVFSSHGFVVCISRLVFNRECPGCGMIRSADYLVRGDFASAYELNKMIFIVLPIFIYYWLKNILNLIIKINTK